MSYTLGVDPARYILCDDCGRKSYHPEDIKQRYCGACHKFHAVGHDRAKLEPLTLRAALLLLLDQVDYTTGACRLTSLVGAVLDPKVLELVKAALDHDKTEQQPPQEGG